MSNRPRLCYCGVVIPKDRTFCVKHGGVSKFQSPYQPDDSEMAGIGQLLMNGPSVIIDLRGMYRREAEAFQLLGECLMAGPSVIKYPMSRAIFPESLCDACGVEIELRFWAGKEITNCGSPACRRAVREGRIRKPNIIPLPKSDIKCENPECSETFPAGRGGKKYCTNDCRRRHLLAIDPRHFSKQTAKYQNENPDKVKESQWRRRQAEIDASFPELPVRLVAKSKSSCAYCGSKDNLEREHIIPLSRNGAHSPRNVIWACVTCNRGIGGKHDKTLAEWRPELAERFPGQTVDEAHTEAILIRERRRFTEYTAGTLTAIPDDGRFLWVA